MDKNIHRAAKLIAAADSLIIAAGAGMGVDSGLPDFRGDRGLWQVYPALAEDGLGFADIANPAAFTNHKHLAWGFYAHRLNMYRATNPHIGFKIILDWIKKFKKEYFIFTSNVDGQFQKAGFAQDRVFECHGSIHHVQCLNTCSDEIWPFPDNFVLDVNPLTYRLAGQLPLCAHCGGLARPNILMFNDWSWISDRSDNQQELMQQWLNRLSGPPLILEIGAGIAVPTVRAFTQSMEYNGSSVIRINLRDAHIKSQKRIELAMGAKSALMAINDILDIGQAQMV